jgi:cytosine deaminase
VLDADLLAAVVTELAQAGVGVVTLPITNLYLQGWDHPSWTPRGLTAVRALLDAGVTLAGGGDNIRDPFNPVGRADPLETASLLVVAGHLSVEESVAAVTAGGRKVMGLPVAGPQVGAAADLLMCKGSSLRDVVARGPRDRMVVHAGRVVSASVSSSAVAGVQR